MAEYIEREALENVLCEERDKIFRATKDRYLNGKRDAFNEAHSLMLELPSADVAPVRHAKWGVEVGMNFFKERNCPVCKRRIESNFWNYCPNCGAKMDLEG